MRIRIFFILFLFFYPSLQIDLKEWYLEMYSLFLIKNPQNVCFFTTIKEDLVPISGPEAKWNR